jgi:signal transduction histidine kinase/ligand-binding sensor domain-containing protein
MNPAFTKILRLLILAALACGEQLEAQGRQVKFERFGLEQGLVQSSITCIVQDRKGLMWFGTYDGLNKFDGYGFTIFKHDSLEAGSLSDNQVLSICEDSTRHALWIGTFGGGLNKFDRDTGQFTHFVNDPQNPRSLSDNRVNAVYVDRAGALWVGTADGLNRFDPDFPSKNSTENRDSSSTNFNAKSGQFTRFINDPANPHSLGHNHVTSIFEDQAGALWIGTAGGLYRLDRATEKFAKFVNAPNNPHSLSSNAITVVYEDSAAPGKLWIGTHDGGLNLLDVAAGQFTRFANDPKDPSSLSANDVRAICADSAARNSLWIGTFGGGLDRFDRASGKFSRFANDPNDPHSLSDNRVIAIYENPLDGMRWVGTHGGGLNKFRYEKEKFAHFANDPKNSRSLSHNRVWAICEDRGGTLWLGTEKGLNRLDPDFPSKNSMENRDFPAENFNGKPAQFTQYFNDPQNPHSLSANSVRAICEDSRNAGVFWIGTNGGGLNRFDRTTGKFTRFLNDPQNPHSLSHNRVQAICGDSGRLWIGTYDGGLNRFDYSSGKFDRFVNAPQDPHSLSHNRVWCLYEDRAGTLWIGTSGGLNKLIRSEGEETDGKKERFIRFVNDPNDPHSLSHNAVFAIYEDRAGRLWIGTYGGGLNQFDRAAGKFTRYTTQEGLANNVVYGILEDGDGQLWLSTNYGLSRFNPQTRVFRNYDKADGLQSNEFNAGAYFKSASGEMFFGGVNGFNAFYPDRVKDNPYVPPVTITAFKIFDHPVKLGRAHDALETLRLSYKQNFFSFEFAALNYNNTPKNQYAYKMEGFDEDWIYCRLRRYASYTNLDPGKYVFRVKGSNDDGVWNEAGVAIALTITPPWWRTGWAYALYGLLLISSVVAVDRFQRRRLIAKERARTQIMEAELRAQAAEAQALALEAENARKKNVELLSEIGKEITASLDFDTIFYRVYENVNRLADATIFGVGIYHAERNLIEYKLAIQNGKRYAPFTREASDKNQFPVWCIEHRQPVLINDVTQEYRRYISDYKHVARLLEDGSRSAAPLALIYLPLLVQNRVLGVITIQSFQKNAYTEYHLNILQNLAAYTAIALDNAGAYRQLDATLKNLQAAQEQLIVQEKMASLGQLTAGIAHEIKNPLNFVNNFAVLTLDLAEELREAITAQSQNLDAESKANVLEILRLMGQNVSKINEHGKRADSIVKGMLLHSRGESGERRPADINAILDEYVMLGYHGMRGLDSTFNVKIEKDYDPLVGRVEVFPQDLSRVFLNLVNNACYATREKKKARGESYSPVLSVRTQNLGDKIEIRIRDNGTGIPKTVVNKIFHPFFTTKPAGQGTGLGLSISYDIIVQGHGGEIKVDTAEGEFTEFVIILPKGMQREA